ncbi:MAG TPA: DUF177 domain-containing protein [Candidatus Eisenbacteria bacterium]|jgi:uncharacterized protein
MQIELRTLPQGESRLEMELSGDSVGLAPADLRLSGPLHVGLILDRRGDEIWIRGSIQAVTPQQCSRCLTVFRQSLELDFQVFCAKVRPHSTIGPALLDEEEGGVHFHDGRVLTIDEEIREAVILGIPMRPLCRESCLGLCPQCGEDRNLGPCRCERGV